VPARALFKSPLPANLNGNATAPHAVQHAELEAIDRDLKTIGRRLEWLDRNAKQAREREAEMVKLEQRKRQLKTA
jgi:hypothetical protein